MSLVYDDSMALVLPRDRELMTTAGYVAADAKEQEFVRCKCSAVVGLLIRKHREIFSLTTTALLDRRKIPSIFCVIGYTSFLNASTEPVQMAVVPSLPGGWDEMPPDDLEKLCLGKASLAFLLIVRIWDLQNDKIARQFLYPVGDRPDLDQCALPFEVRVMFGPENEFMTSLSQRVCDSCFLEKRSMLRCQGCRVVAYCSRECQVKNWNDHRVRCPLFAQLKQHFLPAMEVVN